MTSVLDGIRVLDLSQGISGPIAGMLLSDHGAAITKVEPPGGDRFRSLPGSNAWLRGRRSIELDLAKPDDRPPSMTWSVRRRRAGELRPRPGRASSGPTRRRSGI